MHPTVRRSSRIAPRSSLALALLLLLAALAVAALRPAPAPAATITVTTTADSNPPLGTCSLRMAIQAANGDTPIGSGGGCTRGSGADTITFAPGLTGTIALTATLPAITSAITIQGPGAGSLTISGGDAVRILQVQSGA
ncbi:MAG: CSLREA domain-containing protein, partial [Dehalococcoidia bacterium]